MSSWSKKLEGGANIAIILVAIIIGVVFVKNYLLSSPPAPESRDYRIPAGTKLSLPEVDWAHNGETLLLVLQKGCHFCAESAPFYQRLARDAAAAQSRIRLVAVLPQETSEAKQYLSSLNVPIDEVKQSALDALGVQGTPTLILVNEKGEVMQSWVGKLPAEKEAEVLRQVAASSKS